MWGVWFFFSISLIRCSRHEKDGESHAYHKKNLRFEYVSNLPIVSIQSWMRWPHSTSGHTPKTRKVLVMKFEEVLKRVAVQGGWRIHTKGQGHHFLDYFLLRTSAFQPKVKGFISWSCWGISTLYLPYFESTYLTYSNIFQSKTKQDIHT